MSKPTIIAFLVGIIFAVGLGISGMTQPSKVVGFLDIAGDWDPSLAFVMIGAIGIHALSYLLVKKRETPLLATQFSIPTNQNIDPRLIGGAILFGTGWGLGGFCPGPALVSLVSLQSQVLLFCGGMLIGFIGFRFFPKGSTQTPQNQPS